MPPKRFVLNNKTHVYIPNDKYTKASSCAKILKETPKIPQTNGTFELSLGTILQNHDVVKSVDQIKLFKAMNCFKHKACKAVQARSYKLANNYLAKAYAIRDGLINSNTRLVVSIVTKIRNKQFADESYDNIMSNANLALIKSVDLFDPFKGYCFSTYATRSITSEIYEALYRKTMETTPIAEDIIVDYREEHLKAEFEHAEITQYLNNILSKLVESDKEIIVARFGLNGKVSALQEIADKRGLSKERVRQIQTRIMKEIREIIRLNKLTRLGTSLCA